MQTQLAFLSFLLEPYFQNLIQVLLSFGKFCLDFGMSAKLLFHPWMTGNLLDSWPLFWIVCCHVDEHRPKCFPKISWRSAPLMVFPEIIEFLGLQQLKVRIRVVSPFKRRTTCIHDKQNDSSRKYISLFAFIILGVNLGRHVPFSSQFRVKYA